MRLSPSVWALLASTPQPTRGETEKGSSADATYFQSLTVNRVARVVWCYLTEGFCSGVRVVVFLWTPPQPGPQPQHHPNMWAYESNWVKVMNHPQLWLFYHFHIWVKDRREYLEMQWDSLIKLFIPPATQLVFFFKVTLAWLMDKPQRFCVKIAIA